MSALFGGRRMSEDQADEFLKLLADILKSLESISWNLGSK